MGPEPSTQKRPRQLTTNTREALLLRAIEEFSAEETGLIMGIAASDVLNLISVARDEVAEAPEGRVIIIEDEAVLAMDLEAIVASMGHTVCGIARSEAHAEKIAADTCVDVILSERRLTCSVGGTGRTNGTLARMGNLPRIVITALPDRLLTGEGQEPAFVMSKPYSEEQVRSTVGQAMLFSPAATKLC
ncbi:hypothetical protein PNH50_18950 (plasmid) [Leisingera aquaemixtae]|uniref:hypothetical protein n=1 Tax=Leisingera aquaemixtae TaxID=1396826 RepID=UPI00398450E7